MKKSLFSIFALAAMLFSACQAEKIETSSTLAAYDYTFEIASSKALIGDNSIVWEEGDKIGTFAGGLNNNAGAITIGTPCTFSVKSQTALAQGDKVYAYYPYSANAGDAASSVAFTIPAAQTINEAGFDADAMPMAAVPYTVQSAIEPGTATPVGGINFRNLGSIIEFRLYSDGTVAAGDKIQSVKFQASEENICGSYTADITAAEAALAEVAGEKSVTSTFATPVDVPASKDDAVVCNMVVAPATVSGTIFVYTDNATYAKAVNSKTYARNAVKPLALSIATMTDITVKFDVEGAQSFNFEENKNFNLTVADAVNDLSVKTCPSGWSAVLNGKTLEVTAPSDETEDLEGDIVLEGLGMELATLKVRLYGINSKADLLAFRAVHGGTNTEHTALIADAEKYAASIAPYKVGDWVTLNADIEAVTGNEFYNNYYAYFMHYIYEKIDGNGHTINLDVNGENTATLLVFFQHVMADIKNLNFAGQMTQTTKDACVIAPLAQQISKEATIDNVNSSVNITTAKKNCKIGGLIALGASEKVTVKNCNYSGTITVNAAANHIGGVFGNQTAGNGVNRLLTVDNCTFSGKIEYTSIEHYKETRIGGILGSQERNGLIQNCTNSGQIIFNLENTIIVGTESTLQGIGGITGRCNAARDDASYKLSTTIKDCAFTGEIIFNQCNPEQPKTYIGKIIGNKLSGYQEEASTGNTETGTITYNYPDPVGSISFNDASELSFAYGETRSIDITTSKMSTLEAVTLPKGWTIDFSNFKNGSISVTAPADGTGDINGAIDLSLKGKDETSVTAYSSNTKTIRLFGINNAAEIIKFNAAYQANPDAPVTTGDEVAKYLVNGEITINENIDITSGLLYTAYWIKNLVLPINGNGHTLTYSTSKGHRGALVQNLKADVHDLNLAGTITLPNPGSNDIQAGALACANYKNGVKITNVNSSVSISASGTQNTKTNYIGGLIGNTSNENYTANFVNCTVSGNISYSIANQAFIGGIIAWTRAGNPGGVTNMTNCTHSGKIDVTKKSDAVIRVGGLMGSSERKAVLTSCTNSGNLTIDCAGYAFNTVHQGNCGLGGLIGRQSGQADGGYDMTCTVTDCTNTGTITLKNAVKNDFNVESSGNQGCVGQFVGTNCNYGKTYSEAGTCTKTGSVVITYAE